MATNLTAGLVGFSGGGKTTVFNLLTGQDIKAADHARANIGVARVPDQRVDFLSNMFKPRRTVYAQIQLSDVPGLVRGNRKAAAQFLSSIRDVDMLIYVLRAFNDPSLQEDMDPQRDLAELSLELVLVDMEVVERRLERIKAGKKVTGEVLVERDILMRCLEALEKEEKIGKIDFSPEQMLVLKNFGFLTVKPAVIVVNMDEDNWRSKKYPQRQELMDYAREQGLPVMEICGLMEMEIGQLPPEDRESFMSDLGIGETGIDRLARVIYQQLGLISFFTVGEDEVKAWTISQGTPARKAAGKIHSDIERGFIRAEVYHYNDLLTHGSVAALREKGLLRLEGKDYLVQDGDIINFRFNV